MVCDIRCKTARTDREECECSCNGANHGVQKSMSYEDDVEAQFLFEMGYETLHPNQDRGGMLQLVLEFLHGYESYCIHPKPGCGHAYPSEEDHRPYKIGKETLILGEHHSGGVEDGDGQKWWVVVICPSPDCQYQTAWHKILGDRSSMSGENSNYNDWNEFLLQNLGRLREVKPEKADKIEKLMSEGAEA